MSAETDPFEIKCCRCGKSKTVNGQRYPQFAHEILNICPLVGFVGTVDFRYQRALVFCSADCKDASKNKYGHFKAKLRFMEAKKDRTSNRLQARIESLQHCEKEVNYKVTLANGNSEIVNQPNGEQWHYENGLLIKIFGVKDSYVCEIKHFEVERNKRQTAVLQATQPGALR